MMHLAYSAEEATTNPQQERPGKVCTKCTPRCCQADDLSVSSKHSNSSDASKKLICGHNNSYQQGMAEDPSAELRASIERLGCHIPRHVALDLEYNISCLSASEVESFTALSDTTTSGKGASSQNVDDKLELSWDEDAQQNDIQHRIRRRGSKAFQQRRRSSLDVYSRSDSATSFDSLESSNSSSDHHYDDTTVRNYVPGQFSTPKLPMAESCQYHDAALLMVDVSGFTRLSTILDVETLSNVISDYFESLIRQVEIFGGDVLKFAGDAFFAEWRAGDNSRKRRRSRRCDFCGSKLPEKCNEKELEDDSLQHAVLGAALCGESIVRLFSEHKIQGIASDVALLNVHCGIGVGKIATLHVGNDQTRREWLFLGDPIDQISLAESMAKNGEVVASMESINLLAKMCHLPDDIRLDDGPHVIARREERFFEPKKQWREEVNKEVFAFKLSSEIPVERLKPLKHLMSLYVHPVARRLESQAKFYSRDAVVDAEIRSVYTMFIKSDIPWKIAGDKRKDNRLFLLLNDIVGATMTVLDRYKGHLRQFIVDDKGVVLIATFGLRGSTFPNMVPEKGLPATLAIYETLQMELGIDCVIGATYGKAYCGAVGGLHRHEFFVMGPSVNLAARLMCSDYNPGILVDDAVRQAASERFDFLAYTPIKAKGYSNAVPIFEPQSIIERNWNKIEHFVGRENELKRIIQIGKKLVINQNARKARMVLIEAQSGFGKSSLAMQAIEQTRRMGGSRKKKVAVIKNVCKDGERLFPYSVFRQIILDILVYHGAESEIGNDSCDTDAESVSSIDSMHQDAMHIDLLVALCQELNYSEEFADSLGQSMLGLHPANIYVGGEQRKKLTPNDVLDFVVDAFLLRTAQYDFVLLALDDIQWMDSLSWKVVQRLVDRGENLMILCLCRPFAMENASIDPSFLRRIQEEKAGGGKKKTGLSVIQLQPFSENDILMILSMTFGCDPGCIKKEVCDYVLKKSGGIPYYVQEIVKVLKDDSLLENSQGLIGLQSGQSNCNQTTLNTDINGLLLHRLDRFQFDGRTLLQLCAILGFEFSLIELLEVQYLSKNITHKQIKHVQDVLAQAVEESILAETCHGRKHSMQPNNGNGLSNHDEVIDQFGGAEKVYSFRHAIWRNCLLGTMLEERKCDLHHCVAVLLESKNIDIEVDLQHGMRLFRHWKASGNLAKTCMLAKAMSKNLDGLLFIQQSIELCLEAIEMWKYKGGNKDKTLVAGISKDLLDSISPEELDCLARLHISAAKNHNPSMPTFLESFDIYQDCDLILKESPASAHIKDRSIFFVLYSGMFNFIQSGLIADDKEVDEEGVAVRFVEQARIHGEPVHIARAIAMESLTFSLVGKFEEAIAAQKRLEQIYSAKNLSEGLCREYASDRAAQNYGYSVLWYEIMGRHEDSQNQIDFILSELMPLMPEKNVHNSLMVLYPVLFLLVDKGMAKKAERLFHSYVYDRFYKFYGKESTTFFLFIYETLKALFFVAGQEQDQDSDRKKVSEIEEWVLSEKVGEFPKIFVINMCAMGRSPHCMIAEICVLLALRQKYDVERRKHLIDKGMAQAKKSAAYMEEKPGLEYARRQCNRIIDMFQLVS